MKVKSNLFSLSRNLDSLLAALAGFILILIFSKHSGIGVSPDSVTYLSAARHLVGGKGFISFDNFPVVDFPFAYPFFLAIISFFTGMDPLQSAPVVNGMLFGLLLYLYGAIPNGFQHSSAWYKRIMLVCILLSPAIQELYSMLWSETIFLLLILLFILSICQYLAKTTTRWLIISALVCAIACITRYAGVFLVPTGLCLIFFNPNPSLKKRINHVILFGLLSISLFVVNIMRNELLTGMAMGQRQKSDAGLFKILENFGGVFCDWLTVDRTPMLSIFFALSALLVFALTIIFLFRGRASKNSFEFVMATTGLMYGLFMVFTSALTRYEQFTNRLLSPIYIPLLCCLTWWIPGFLSKRDYRFRWLWTMASLLLAAWFLNIQLAADYEYYDGVKDAGMPGYREDPFVQSAIVQFVKNSKTGFNPNLPIYSNAGDAVYFITGLPARQLPVTAFPAKVQEYYGMKSTYLVWFNDLDNPEMPALDRILQNKNLQLLKELPDGAVYVSK